MAGSNLLDSDNDGVTDDFDAFPNNPSSKKADTDGDGFEDNSVPDDPNETVDSDGDGVGDNADAFPYDATKTMDSDGIGVGDNTDTVDYDLVSWGDENFTDSFTSISSD